MTEARGAAAAAIRDEVRALADFYGAERCPPLAALDSPLLQEYVEIVLREDQLELVLGGVGRDAEVCALAEAHGVHPEALATFRAFCQRFPDNMFYAKLCPQRDESSVYLVLLKPWEELWEIFLRLGFRDEVLGAIQDNVSDHRICFMLSFNHSAELGGVQVKAYHLADRDAESGPEAPFLVSWRFGRSSVEPEPKLYSARARWGDFRAGPAWAEVAAKGEALFGDRHELVKGVSGDGKVKCYVFRYDVRESARYSMKSYNWYLEEGYQLMKLSAFAEAERAYRHALLFDPGNVDAQNLLGYAILMQGRYLEGIRVALSAQAKNPRLTNLIWQWANPTLTKDGEIERLSALIERDPQPRWYHERAIQHFHARDYRQAKADLLQAIALQPLFAEAYNDLGGTLIQLGEFVQAVKRCTLAHSINRQTNDSNLTISRTALRLIRETEQRPSVQSFRALGKFYYQLDMFAQAERCFVEAERLEGGERGAAPPMESARAGDPAAKSA